MKYITLIVILLVTGCASSAPDLKQYLLRSDTPGRFIEGDSTTVIGIGAVKVASYIDELGLVLEVADGEVRAARHHQWAEPLRESLRTFLAREISATTGQVIRFQQNREANWHKRIDISIDELHGTVEGDARLVAYWTVSDIEQKIVVSVNNFTDTEDLTNDGYTALVQAQKELLHKLAVAIAATL